jgi:TIR domain
VRRLFAGGLGGNCEDVAVAGEFGRLTARLRGLISREGSPLRVFVSYRREAGPGQAHHLSTDLERYLGAEHVFLDERAIGAGEDFDAVISERVGGADVLLAVIGPGWVEMAERLHDERDYVRREIEAALVRRVPVIPVTTPGATLPDAGVLPDSLQPMRARPTLAVDIPSDVLWAVAVDSLGRWLVAIREEKRRHDRELQQASDARHGAERELERAHQRDDAAGAAHAATAAREAALSGELPVAQEELARLRGEAEPTRIGAGIRVFVCHRGESAAEAARLAGNIGGRIGADHVLVGAPLGAPESDGSPSATVGAVEQADALLALIGPGWLEGAATDGDRVTGELDAAIARGVPIIPVLTRRAALPERSALPASLQPLLGHQALMLPEQFWDTVVERLIERLGEIERSIVRREEAVAAAEERTQRLERDLAHARRAVQDAHAAITDGGERMAAAEAAVAAAQERERELGAEPRDANRAYLAGPPAPRPLATR